MEICVFDNFDLKETSLANKRKKFQKMFLFHDKIGRKKTSTYCKSNGKPKLQMCLSQNYDFVFTNLLKNGADLKLDMNGYGKPYPVGCSFPVIFQDIWKWLLINRVYWEVKNDLAFFQLQFFRGTLLQSSLRFFFQFVLDFLLKHNCCENDSAEKRKRYLIQSKATYW